MTTTNRETLDVNTDGPRVRRALLAAGLAATMIGLTATLGGCLAVAAGAGAGVGYAVGHENGEDHVQSGEHPDDD